MAAAAPVSGAAARRSRDALPAWLKIVMSKNYASNRDIIVSVFMRGSADGLSICVPFADANCTRRAQRSRCPDPTQNDEGHQS